MRCVQVPIRERRSNIGDNASFEGTKAVTKATGLVDRSPMYQGCLSVRCSRKMVADEDGAVEKVRETNSVGVCKGLRRSDVKKDGNWLCDVVVWHA
jgi:hypothetical protein